jgi:hypothetical protein
VLWKVLILIAWQQSTGNDNNFNYPAMLTLDSSAKLLRFIWQRSPENMMWHSVILFDGQCQEPTFRLTTQVHNKRFPTFDPKFGFDFS